MRARTNGRSWSPGVVALLAAAASLSACGDDEVFDVDDFGEISDDRATYRGCDYGYVGSCRVGGGCTDYFGFVTDPVQACTLSGGLWGTQACEGPQLCAVTTDTLCLVTEGTSRTLCESAGGLYGDLDGCSPASKVGSPCGPCGRDTLLCVFPGEFACSGSTACGDQLLPSPRTLTATDGDHAEEVRLGWLAVDGATRYEVQRDGAHLAWTEATTFTDMGAAQPERRGRRPVLTMAWTATGLNVSWPRFEPSDGRVHTYTVRAWSRSRGYGEPVSDTGHTARTFKHYEIDADVPSGVSVPRTTYAALLTIPVLPAVDVPRATVRSRSRGVELSAGTGQIVSPDVRVRVRAVSNVGPEEWSDTVRPAEVTGPIDYLWERDAFRGAPALRVRSAEYLDTAVAGHVSTIQYTLTATATGARPYESGPAAHLRAEP